MNEVLHRLQHLRTLAVALLGNLISQAPHHDTRMQTVGKYQILQIALPPVVIKTAITVLTLRIDPHIERLCHH